jgi:hypothetical protein
VTTSRRPYRLDLLDVRQGVAGSHVVAEENGAPVMLALRPKVVDRRISEIETLVVRNQKEGIRLPRRQPRPAQFAQRLARDRARENEAVDAMAKSADATYSVRPLTWRSTAGPAETTSGARIEA